MANQEQEWELIQANIGLVISILQSFGRTARNRQEDLLQEGMMGFLHAIRTYDPSRGATIATHAWWHIRAYIGRAIRSEEKHADTATCAFDEDYMHPRMNCCKEAESIMERDEEHTVRRAIGNLDPAMRRYMLQRLTGKSVREIGDAEGVAYQVVSSSLRRGIRRLRLELS